MGKLQRVSLANETRAMVLRTLLDVMLDDDARTKQGE